MPPKQAHTDRLLREDVVSMLLGTRQDYDEVDPHNLAKDIITMVRERVLREIMNYARNNIK